MLRRVLSFGNTIMVPYNVGNCLSSSERISFSRRARLIMGYIIHVLVVWVDLMVFNLVVSIPLCLTQSQKYTLFRLTQHYIIFSTLRVLIRTDRQAFTTERQKTRQDVIREIAQILHSTYYNKNVVFLVSHSDSWGAIVLYRHLWTLVTTEKVIS
jgi:hypothetical protein